MVLNGLFYFFGTVGGIGVKLVVEFDMNMKLVIMFWYDKLYES